MMGGTQHELNKMKLDIFKEGMGERNYGEAFSNLNMSLTPFDHFLAQLGIL